MQKEGEAGENSSYGFTKLLQVRQLPDIISFNLNNDPVKDGLLYVGGNSGLGRLSY